MTDGHFTHGEDHARVAGETYNERCDQSTVITRINAPGSTIHVGRAEGLVTPEDREDMGRCRKCRRELWIGAQQCLHCGYAPAVERAIRERADWERIALWGRFALGGAVLWAWGANAVVRGGEMMGYEIAQGDAFRVVAMLAIVGIAGWLRYRFRREG